MSIWVVGLGDPGVNDIVHQGPARSPAHIVEMLMELVRVAGGGERCNACPLEVSHPKPIWNFH